MTKAEITIKPDSRYKSLVRMTIRLHITKDHSTISFRFLEDMRIVMKSIDGMDTNSTAEPYSIMNTSSHQILTLKTVNEKQVKVEAKLAGVLDDSGWNLHPFMTSHLKMKMETTGVDELSFYVSIPPESGFYSAFTYLTINDKKHDWHALQYYSRGEGAKKVSTVGQEYISNQNNIAIEFSAKFRLRPLKLPSLVLSPLLIGFPLIILWGVAEADIGFATKLTSSLASIPVVFALWHRSTSDSIDPFDYLNLIWLVSATSWLAYAIFFHLTTYWLTTNLLNFLFFTPYAVWLLYHVGLLVWFRNIPINRGEIPKWFWGFLKGRKHLVRTQDTLSYDAFKEPEAK